MTREIAAILKSMNKGMALIIAAILADAENRQLARQQQREKRAKARLFHEILLSEAARKRRPY